MMVEDEFGGRRMNDLRTVVWLNMIDSMRATLWFGVALASLARLFDGLDGLSYF
jgi:hypothetical protein